MLKNTEEAQGHNYHFDDLVVDCQNFRVQKQGVSQPLAPRAFDVLRYLIEQHGRVVEKQELFENIWQDAIVTDDALTRAVKEIRRALGDDATAPRYVETVPKRGYRFIAELQTLEEALPPEPEKSAPVASAPPEPAAQSVETEPLPLPTPKPLPRVWLFGQRKRLPLLLGILLLISVGFWLYFRPAGRAPIESLAVLPFVNEGGNGEVEYLSDGMTETLISSLSQIPNLNVKPRSSVFRYKGKSANPQTIGKELNVQALLQGTIVQRGPDVALHIELIDAPTERVLWSADYQQPLANLVTLQSELRRELTSQLKIKLTGADAQQLVKRATGNAEAYQLYLRGRYHWLRFPAPGFEKVRDYYQQAIAADPNYALAYAGLAEYYSFGAAIGVLPPAEYWPQAETAANKALALDNRLPDAYNALAGVKQHQGDLAGAERDLRQAIELNPNYAEGRNHLSFFLMQVGRVEESLAEMKKVMELEPLSVRYNWTLALRFFHARDYDRAIKQYEATLELDPNDAYTHELLGDAFEQKGRQQEAIAEWSKGLALRGDNELALLLERTYAASGFAAAERALWQKKLARLNEKADRGAYVPAMDYALAHTRLANQEQALAWLAKAEQERNTLIYEVKLNPIYDRLRSDPRFQGLLRRVGMSK